MWRVKYIPHFARHITCFQNSTIFALILAKQTQTISTCPNRDNAGHASSVSAVNHRYQKTILTSTSPLQHWTRIMSRSYLQNLRFTPTSQIPENVHFRPEVQFQHVAIVHRDSVELQNIPRAADFRCRRVN